MEAIPKITASARMDRYEMLLLDANQALKQDAAKARAP